MRFIVDIWFSDFQFVFLCLRPGVLNRQERITKCCDSLRARLNELNGAKERDIEEIIKVAVENFVANVRWRFLDPNGPQVGTVTGKKPLMHRLVSQFTGLCLLRASLHSCGYMWGFQGWSRPKAFYLMLVRRIEMVIYQICELTDCMLLCPDEVVPCSCFQSLVFLVQI